MRIESSELHISKAPRMLLIAAIIGIFVPAAALLFPKASQMSATASADKPNLVIQTGHTDSAHTIAFSPDGSLLASGSSDRTVKLWEVSTGRQIRSFEGTDFKVESIAFSPDGKTIASGGAGGAVLWEVRTGQLVKSFIGQPFAVLSIGFSPNGEVLVMGCSNRFVRLWNIETEEQIRVIDSESSQVDTVAFSPDGRIIASSSSSDNIKLWDAETGSLIRSFEGLMFSVAFSPDGKFLAAGGRENVVKVWNIETGELIRSFAAPASLIRSIAFSPDGKTVASASLRFGTSPTAIKLWNIETGEQTGSIEEDADLGLSFVAIKFSPDGRTIASGSNSNSVKLWDAVTGRQITSFDTHSYSVSSVAFSPDGKWLASGNGDRTVKLWDLKRGMFVRSLEGHFLWVEAVTFSADSKMLASGSAGTIKLWNVESGEELRSIEGHERIITSLAFSPDGKTIVSCSEDETVKLWSTETGEQLRSFDNHTDAVLSVAFSPDGKLIASGSADGTIRSWDAETGEELRSFGEMGIWVAFSPDGKTLAAAIGDFTISLWDISTGKHIRSLERHSNVITSIAFSPNGEILISGSNDRTVRLWDVKTGRNLRTLDGHSNVVNSVAFSPEGSHFVSGSFDSTIKLWSLSSEMPLATLISLDKNDWVVTTTEGRFDTNKLEDTVGLYWLLPDAPLTPLSFEIFMRDLYEPNLLPRLIKCSEENDCNTEFKPVRNIAEINRTQPGIRITEIVQTSLAHVVEVKVEVDNKVSESQKDRQNKPLRSGASDLRLFRDGQLVGYAPDNDGNLTLDSNGRFSKVFSVMLPRNTGEKEFNFTAYAFNTERVKSETAHKTYRLPKPLTAEKGNAYIISIGVNTNEDKRYDLRFAANDARRFSEEVVKNLPKNKYGRIIQLPLISDNDTDGNLKENNATKPKIKSVLGALAGKTISKEDLKDIPNAGSLKKVQPEDMVLITFAGHGYADKEGIFYIIPSDIGTNNSAGLAGALGKSISSDELSLWLRDIDAGEMIMIVDACHSAAAVQGQGFKPGPMGSRGLGQLSYDKGMRILTATQADNVALELGELQHGLLTYSLINNGIIKGMADTIPRDKQLYSSEWLEFAVSDVPDLYRKIKDGEVRGILIDGAKPRSDIITFEGQKSNLNLQQPSLFDFNRRSRTYQLMSLPDPR